MTADELAVLWRQVAHVAAQRVAVLEQAVHALSRGTVDVAARRAVAVEECHKLVGSLDSFGRSGGSALALRVADLLEQPDPDLASLTADVAELRRLVAGPST